MKDLLANFSEQQQRMPQFPIQPVGPEYKPPTQLSRQGRQYDPAGSYSSGYGDMCPDGVPVEQALFGILAAFGASFGFLFRAITMITQAPRKKKRSSEYVEEKTWWQQVIDGAADMYWLGRLQN